MSVASVLTGDDQWHVEHARCEAFSASLPDGCVSLLWLDPPYFRVVDEEWDRAWRNEADYLAWLRGVVREAARVLAPNGSLYLFASPALAWHVEGIARENLNVLNHVTWAKPDGWHRKQNREALRSWCGQTERVIFAEHARPDRRTSIGDALRGARERAGINTQELALRLGHTKPGGEGNGIVWNWENGLCIPSAPDFAAAMVACGNASAVYEDLRREYESLRRHFDAPESFTDVWTYPIILHDIATKHPCQKPDAMLSDVVRCSSRPNDVVCEFFGGSFRMAEVALGLGRRYIGCDADEHWARVGVERATAAQHGTVPLVAARKQKPVDTRQTSLFGDKK